MIKKIIATALSVSMIFVLGACSTTTSNNSTKTTKTENKEEYIPSELVEKSPSFLDLIVSKLTVNNKEGEA